MGSPWNVPCNNQTVFAAERGRAIATYVGLSGAPGNSTRLIGAFSNSGGRESLGGHQTALDDVANMLPFMQNYGVDPLRVVNFGISRGGGTALLWGENPAHGDNYTSIGVFALMPPSHSGFISQQALASYQYLHQIATDMFNNPNADRYGAGQKIDINPAPVTKLLLDQDDPWKADRPQEDYTGDNWRKSPSGHFSLLRNKPVVLGVGTHDAIIPLPMFLRMDRTLKERWAIPHLTCLTLRSGHTYDEDDCPRAELDRFLEALRRGDPSYTVPDTRRYFKATNFTFHPFGSAEELTLNPNDLPFSITVPYRLTTWIAEANRFQWATLAACGQTGRTYSATLTWEDNGQVVYTTGAKTFGTDTWVDFNFDGLIDPSTEVDSECDVIRLDQQPGWQVLPVDETYRWSFTYQGQPVPAGNLSYFDDPSWNRGRPTVATTEITPGQPYRPEAIFDFGGSITMGVDQF